MKGEKKMSNKNIVAIILVLALVIGVGAYSVFNNMLNKPLEEETNAQEQVEPAITDEEEKEPAIIAPLTGLAVEEKITRRPLAVTIENSPAARPQSGLREADVVYEVLAEGGITRFLAIYHQGDAKNVGPIRSARDYLAYLSHDFDGVFVHVGGSPGGLAYVEQKSVDNLNAFYIASGEFWRTKDRVAPHNLYSNTEQMRSLMVKRKMEKDTQIQAWPFLKKDEVFANGQECEYLKIYYPQGFSVVEYEYDPDLRVYARTMGGKPHLDRESNLQLSAKNVIIQYANTKVIDGEGRLNIGVVGSDKAIVFTNGKVYQGKWSKKDKRSRTIFTTNEGEEIPLATGQTWIQIVRKDTQVEYESDNQI